MQRRRVRLAAALVLALAGSVAAAKPVAPAPAAARNDETQAFLRQMGDAQKWMGEELWKLKEKVDDLPGIIAEAKDGQTATQEEIDKLRDEVKGLYVELSTVKQQIEASKGDVQAVNQNLTSFRNSSGIFLAVVLVMAFITMVTTLLRR
jgi:peptidoglycan hydrolase CwlO-like protein